MSVPRGRFGRRLFRPAPAVSIVVILFNMEREGRRTLYSLSSRYQVGVGVKDYEVIVVDNGSVPPFPADYIEGMGEPFRHFYIDDARPSPAAAINFGVQQSRGKYVGTMIDGARMLTPGMIQHALRAFRAFDHPVVTSLAWHLGPDLQRRAIRHGYGREAEDKLLAQIAWPEDGYRLFEISTLAAACDDGWFMPMGDSSCLFLSRRDFDQIGGYDERFDVPGGGLVSHDTYRRACSLPDRQLVVLLGEGTFHQLHGGVSTNTSEENFAEAYRVWQEQYRALRGEPHTRPRTVAHFLGHIPPPARRFLLFSAERALADDPLREREASAAVEGFLRAGGEGTARGIAEAIAHRPGVVHRALEGLVKDGKAEAFGSESADGDRPVTRYRAVPGLRASREQDSGPAMSSG